ncbi:hypothetical protein [Hydrogenophaga pseudoflava]|uniref:hypothetical protein n=1 Tax=Hydrogenophaga pseudoflava TaxID=47421 RepID=UPI0027E588B8|nr:hypothetical protein [Hydrogenophaga pseudoflava]MDQ7744045.1 hypothetical protein [Hydrogenophaga pseudoflava]
MRYIALPLCICSALLAGCDALGIESASQLAERKQAEAHAIGSACRYALRGIEDCFKTNPKAGKAAVFAGWKEMDQYMRDNQIVGMPSAIESPTGEELVEHEGTAPQDEHASGDAKPSTGKKATDHAPASKSSGDARTHKS